jgi:hypothetical protein
MTIDRKIGRRDKLVYLLLAPKPQKHLRGKSRIVYVGTTEKGISRIADTVATRSEKIFGGRGIKTIDVQVVWCAPLQGIKSWKLLERAILAEFLSFYGDLPDCNSQGKSYKWDSKVNRYFKRTAVSNVLLQFDHKRRG